MPEDSGQRSSLAYRRNREAILAGRVPEKYTRLAPHVPVDTRVLEIGAAEGVLSLLLARDPRIEHVVGLELREDRYLDALKLKTHWAALGFDVSRCEFKLGNIMDNLGLLLTVNVLVAIRAIYYLRDDAPRVISAARDLDVEHIVLCGNRSRQTQHREDPTSDLGHFNRLASTEGMTALLEGAGYRVTAIDEGDPIVIGRHPDFTA